MISLIHPTAIVSENSILADDVEVGPFSIIHENVFIGAGTKLGAYCEIGIPTSLANSSRLEIGEGSIIRSHAVIYAGSTIGSKLITGHYVTIRENSIIGHDCQLGNRTDIQGDCVVGNFTKMHADVHVGKGSKIGDFVWLFPEVLLTNDPMPPSDTLIGVTIADYSVLAAKVLVLPGIHIGTDTVVAAGSIVKENIPDGKLVNGQPAKIICNSNVLRMPDNPKIKAYPWRYRFHSRYPIDVINLWLEEFSKVKK